MKQTQMCGGAAKRGSHALTRLSMKTACDVLFYLFRLNVTMALYMYIAQPLVLLVTVEPAAVLLSQDFNRSKFVQVMHQSMRSIVAILSFVSLVSFAFAIPTSSVSTHSNDVGAETQYVNPTHLPQTLSIFLFPLTGSPVPETGLALCIKTGSKTEGTRMGMRSIRIYSWCQERTPRS